MLSELEHAIDKDGIHEAVCYARQNLRLLRMRPDTSGGAAFHIGDCKRTPIRALAETGCGLLSPCGFTLSAHEINEVVEQEDSRPYAVGYLHSKPQPDAADVIFRKFKRNKAQKLKAMRDWRYKAVKVKRLPKLENGNLQFGAYACTV